MHEQSLYSSREFGAERTLLITSNIVGDESNEERVMQVARVLLSRRCFAKRDTAGVELASVQYMEHVSPSYAVDNAAGCVCLQWAPTDSGENGSEVRKSAKMSDCTVAEK